MGSGSSSADVAPLRSPLLSRSSPLGRRHTQMNTACISFRTVDTEPHTVFATFFSFLITCVFQGGSTRLETSPSLGTGVHWDVVLLQAGQSNLPGPLVWQGSSPIEFHTAQCVKLQLELIVWNSSQYSGRLWRATPGLLHPTSMRTQRTNQCFRMSPD